MKKYKAVFWLMIALIGLLFWGCEDSNSPENILKNPNDPKVDAYVPPVTTILSSIDTLQALRMVSVYFEWRGNSDVARFSYAFGKKGTALQWIDVPLEITKAAFDYLDEDAYTFSIRAIHKNGNVQQNPPVVNFTVDAVKGPSVMFLPRKISATVGSPFRIDLKAEEVTAVLAAKLSVQYPPQMVRIDSVAAGPMISAGGSDALMFNSNDAVAGVLKVEFVWVGTSSSGLTGSGSVATLFCTALQAGDADFVFNKSETVYRDSVNAAMVIKECVNGKVVVK